MTSTEEIRPSNIIQASSMPEFDTSENWILWHERLEMHFREIGCETDASKISTLLKTIGSEAYGVVHSLCSPSSPSTKTYKELCDLMSQQYTPPVIVYQERKNFYSSTIAPNEKVAAWFARVKKLAINCKFGAELDSIVKDKFIMELPSKIFEKICEEDESLTLNNAFKKALLRETKLNQSSDRSEVNFVKPHGFNRNNRNNRNNNNNRRPNSNNSARSSNGTANSPCAHCGWKNHTSASCKFRESTCNSCGSIGHLANICRKKDNKNRIKFISNENNGNFSNDFLNSVYSIVTGSNCFDSHVNNVATNKRRLYYLNVKLNGVEHTVECDTGAPCSLMSISTFDRYFNRRVLQPCHEPFSGYTGDSIDIVGEFATSVCYRDQILKGIFVVTNHNRPTLLGRDFLRGFGFELVQMDTRGNKISIVNNINSYREIIEKIKTEYSEVFNSGLGRYNVTKIKLPLTGDASPIYCKARSLPLAFKDGIEKQINELVELGTLVPVTNSDFATPIVPVLKPNGEFRICGDYKSTINRLLVDFKYPLPNIEEIFASMQGGELFTKLDLSNAYNQLELEEDSQNLCTLNTHKGLFRVTRLPFGIKTAAAIFQKTMDALLSEFKNVFCFQDDIVITGSNFSDHLKTLKQVLHKIQQVGLRLNVKKCKFFADKISYLGFDIDKNGLHKNHDRISSVLNAPQPTNVSEVKAFCGMVNYHSKFIPNFAMKMQPLYNLQLKNVKFDWNQECQIAFESMKKEICSENVLAHFDPNQTIMLATDACNTSVAGVLFHRYQDGSERPVAFISRALNSSERNYSTFEKEALAIIFSVTKLKQYLLGNKFTLQTDHKPLLTIFGENKGIPVMAAARIQRWALILSGFNYTIEYVKGSMNSADNLSRISQFETNEPIEESTYINYVGFVNVTQIDYKLIAQYTRRDPILSKVLDSINNGNIYSLESDDFKPYKAKSSELSVESGCVMWGYRTIIPSKLQKEVLLALHSSHMGIVKTKALARSYVYWPKMDKDIEIMINSCEPCQLLQASPEKSSLIPWTPTTSAWKRIHIDFAGPINGFQLFIIIDSYSKWVEVFKTKDTTSSFVVNKLREVFCRFGIVDILVSDNGRQFTSAEFKEFIVQNGINHILTAPGHPSTNGQAENFVKTLKKSLLSNIKQCKSINFDVVLNKFLFDYRITKHCTTDQTPMKLMLGREAKSRFSLMKPPIVTDIIQQKQQTAIRNFRGKRDKSFSLGQNVYVRNYQNPNKDSWSPAIIKRKIGPRNYTCLLIHENRSIKRHLDQIRDVQLERGTETGADDSIVESGENADGTDSEHAEQVETSFSTPINISSSDSTLETTDANDSLDVNNAGNESIADVIERPDTRSCATKAKDAISLMFAGGRNR